MRTHLFRGNSVFLVAVACCVGCDEGASSQPGTTTSSAAGTAQPSQTSAVPPRPTGTAAEPTAGTPRPAELQPTGPASPSSVALPPTAAKTAAADVPARIRLSAGVALPQTLPDGTAVLCSMDYRWESGGPQPDTEYVWVVKLRDGKQVSGPAKVTKTRGTIQMILPGVRPDDGPFEGGVSAKSTTPGAGPTQLSEFISLK